jgi:hypothetical protein
MLVLAPAAQAANVLPTFTTSVTDAKTGFISNLTFVGTDPRVSQTTTVVPTALIALTFKFASGRVMSARRDASLTISSPIFNPLYVSPINGDVSQYGDWIQRAEFGKVGTGYHVLLGLPTVYSLDLTVPAEVGFSTFNKRHVLVGKVDINWLDYQIQAEIQARGFGPGTLPIFLSHNVVAVDGWGPSGCCIGGYHNAVGGQTYVYSAYITPKTFRNWPTVSMSDVNALSHEISEWMNDPYTDSKTEPWSVPSEPQYGCSNWFETGDPLVGISIPVPGNPAHNAGGAWHVQDEAFLNWFTHDGADPALSPLGLYSYAGTFTAPAPACS